MGPCGSESTLHFLVQIASSDTCSLVCKCRMDLPVTVTYTLPDVSLSSCLVTSGQAFWTGRVKSLFSYCGDEVCTWYLYRSIAYVPASRPQLDHRPELFVTSRKQLRPNQQRITLSISGIGTLLVAHSITGPLKPLSLICSNSCHWLRWEMSRWFAFMNYELKD